MQEIDLISWAWWNIILLPIWYRKASSIALALIEITDYIKRLLDERNYMISIFVDLKRAFDMEDHEISSLHKLECFGIWGVSNDFFRSYLINRRQFTVIDTVNSELWTVSWGVPQGSVLGPLLFLLCSNDLHRSTGDNSVKVCADDTARITSNSNLYQAKRIVYKIASLMYVR